MPRHHRLPLALAVAMATVPFFCAAQEVAPAAPVAGVFTPDDFTRFAPRNAMEMLEHVPGFVVRAQVVERGLGQATGNVLLNGRRLSGKSNDVLGELGRIPASDVVRIEILDGATLDIPGLSGQVANVVTEAGGISGTWRWQPDVRKYFTDPQLTRFDVSLSGSQGALEWTLGLANDANHSGAGGHTDLFAADGTLRETRDDAWTGELERPKLSGRLGRTGPTGAVSNLSASVQTVDFVYDEQGVRHGGGLPDRDRTVRSTEGGHNHELGGDHEFALGAGRLKLIGLDRLVDTPIEDVVLTAYHDGSAPDGIRFAREGEEIERIGRAEYRWKHGVADWQLSGEYAFNRLESTAWLDELDAAGAWQPVDGFGEREVVQEDRVELMGTYGRPLGEALTLQASVGAEVSRIEAGGAQRTFVRPKGLVSLAWKASPTLDVNLKLQRRVGQLNFYDFLASVDVNDEQANAGNADLVPPQTTLVDAEAIRDLGAWGSTSVRVYYHHIQDIVDTVPIGVDGESPGNIDTATAYGIEWKASLPLEPLGWRGAKADVRVQHQETRVRDPLTGETRPISNYLEDLAILTLRHDVPETAWAWGSELVYEFASPDVRLTEQGRFWEGPVWGSLFVERKDWHGLTLRLNAGNLLDARSKWNRTVYEGRRTGPVAYTQVTDRRIGPILQFTVSGTF
jgi:outer membrane receptor for ferrienterochelin and colicins